MNLLAELRERFVAALSTLTDNPAPFVDMIRPAQDRKFGDFQANCAMPLGKQLSRAPRDVAQDIVAHLQVSDLCETPDVAGPGFINLKFRDDFLCTAAANLVTSDRLAIAPVTNPKTIVIDYSSPNIAKPMHVGHLRSSVIGNAIERVVRFLGHTVISDNHVGDWGTQFGMIIYGYKHFLDTERYAAAPVAELARLYRLVNQLADYQEAVATLPAHETELTTLKHQLEADTAAARDDKKAKKQLKKLRSNVQSSSDAIDQSKLKIAAVDSTPELLTLSASHPEIARNARLETARLHQGDVENSQLWDQFLPECHEVLNSLYERLGVKFDQTLGESFYQPKLAGVVDRLRSSGLARESDGAICIFIEGNAAPFMIQKGDGAYTYATTDLATIEYRVEEWKADEILYVVDARQSEHFKLLFETASLLGYDGVTFRHVSFGTVMSDDRRPFKTRSGDTVGLESLLDEAVSRARKIVDTNDDSKDNPELNDVSRTQVAEIVGIGGIKYADLRHNRDSDYIFSWDKMLATTGDTATYIQYAYARICGIFRKGQVDRNSLYESGFVVSCTLESERSLLVQLLQLHETLEGVTFDYRPNILTDYLFSTADVFNAFFRDCPVLAAESDEIRQSRLQLCDLTARTIQLGLKLLGIETAEQM